MNLATQANVKISRASLLELLDEYKKECLNAAGLIDRISLSNLTEEQTEDMLADLSVSITHIRIHSEQLEAEIL